MFKKIIRLPEVKSKTGLSRSSIYLRMSNGEFPQSISLGSRAVGWLDADVEQWLDERIAASKAVDHE
ncbi:AlpA family transcriptional regulator [Proteus mirabilis]|nr:AlpA family transcriptional regulator [Proteus mirabilis]